jgi:SUZ domain
MFYDDPHLRNQFQMIGMMTMKMKTITKKYGRKRKFSPSSIVFETLRYRTWIARNARAPMPELIISSSGTTATAVPPPAIAFQTPMRILKRPSSQNSGSNSSSSQTPIETLAQKEARYQAARERIFGGDEGSGKLKGNNRIQKGSPSPSVVNVVRNPIGPSGNCKDTEGGQESKGFRRRSTKGPGSSIRATSVTGSA